MELSKRLYAVAALVTEAPLLQMLELTMAISRFI